MVIMLPNIPEFVISYMSIIGIGAIVIPVNPSYTSHELMHILSDSDSRGIIIEHNKKKSMKLSTMSVPRK